MRCLLVAFGMDQEIPEYDMDSEDEQWLNRQVKHLKMDVSSLKFESMMDRLEKGSGQMVCISAVLMLSQTFCIHGGSSIIRRFDSLKVLGFFSIRFYRR